LVDYEDVAGAELMAEKKVLKKVVLRGIDLVDMLVVERVYVLDDLREFLWVGLRVKWKDAEVADWKEVAMVEVMDFDWDTS
jgi:hypothetical protein